MMSLFAVIFSIFEVRCLRLPDAQYHLRASAELYFPSMRCTLYDRLEAHKLLLEASLGLICAQALHYARKAKWLNSGPDSKGVNVAKSRFRKSR